MSAVKLLPRQQRTKNDKTTRKSISDNTATCNDSCDRGDDHEGAPHKCQQTCDILIVFPKHWQVTSIPGFEHRKYLSRKLNFAQARQVAVVHGHSSCARVGEAEKPKDSNSRIEQSLRSTRGVRVEGGDMDTPDTNTTFYTSPCNCNKSSHRLSGLKDVLYHTEHVAKHTAKTQDSRKVSDAISGDDRLVRVPPARCGIGRIRAQTCCTSSKRLQSKAREQHQRLQLSAAQCSTKSWSVRFPVLNTAHGTHVWLKLRRWSCSPVPLSPILNVVLAWVPAWLSPWGYLGGYQNYGPF